MEAYQSSFNPAALRGAYGSWLGFVNAMGDLENEAAAVLKGDGPFLEWVETTRVTSAHRPLALQAMLLRGTLPGEITLPDLVGTFTTLAARSARLRDEIGEALDDEDVLERQVVKSACQPLAAERSPNGQPFFRLENGLFGTAAAVHTVASSPLAGTLAPLVGELLDWRMAEYLDRAADGVRFRVIQNTSRRPIVKLDRRSAALPEGWATVSMAGRPYRLNFAKEFVNVAHVGDNETNVLPEILRDWFGESAGEPGRRFEVRHAIAEDGSIRWEPEASYLEAVALAGQGTPVVDDAGATVDARFTIEERGAVPTLVFMSRGGGRNDQYNEGLEILLARLARRGVGIGRIYVESGGTRQIAAEGRELSLDGYDYPIHLDCVSDMKRLRKAIGRAAAAVGRAPGAKGAGNATKRLRIELAERPEIHVSATELRVK